MFILHWFAQTKDAIFGRSLQWRYRWRLLVLQPLTLLTYCITYLPWALSSRYSVIQIPTRGAHTVRGLVFRPKRRSTNQLHPIHVDFHGGAFLGGIAEYDASFCELLSDRAGAVVISAQYRYAPVAMYPAAHEDAEDVVEWVIKNAKDMWHADPRSLTVSGFSAGGNLQFVAGRRAKAAVGMYAAVDLRVSPSQKPRPAGFPKFEPFSWAEPLFDAYAGGSKQLQAQRRYDARLSPILRPVHGLPANILFIVAGIDILQHEQVEFIERLNRDLAGLGISQTERRFECVIFDRGFHGWLELPSWAIGKQGVDDRRKAFDSAIEFLVSTKREQGEAE